MELRLILSAIKRSRLIIIFTTLACTVPAFVFWATSSTPYTAKTVLYIQPPAAQGGGNINYNDPDRYVVSQLSVLESSGLADSVAKKLKVKDPKSVERSVTFTHTPKTDLISITASNSKADTAQAIANAFADLYVEEQVQAVKKSQEPAFAALDKRLETINEALAEADRKLNADPTDSLAGASRDSLTAEYGEVVRAKTNLQYLNRVDVRSSVLERATTATPGGGASLPLQIALGLVVGLGLGVAAALAIAIFSSTASDPGQIEEALGVQPIGPIKVGKDFPDHIAGVLTQPTGPYTNAAKTISIRAEALVPQTSSTLSVAVVSAYASTGTTSLAAAVAGYFARSGSQVVLVDGNEINPTLTAEFEATGGERFVKNVDEALSRQLPVEMAWLHRVLAPTPIDNLRVLGGLAKYLHRGNLPTVVKTLRNFSKVTVIDCPPTETSPTSVRLASSVDVIVYVVPVNRMRLADLKMTAQQFGSTPVLIALTRVGARQFFFG